MIGLLYLILSVPLHAEVRELSLDLKRMPFQRDYMFPDQTDWDAETKLTANGSIGLWFIDNQITGRTYGSRYRYVSWEFNHGINILPWLDIIHSHKSEHAIDLYLDKFSVRDSYGIRLKFKE
jgi:hypothetical protein